MRKVVWSTPISLDGFVEGPNGLDWVIADAELHELATAEEQAADLMLFGRVTYQLFVDYWPTAAADPANPPYVIDYANAINRAELKKIVYSKTLDKVGWNAQLVRELIPGDIAAMKAQPGKDIIVAGPTLGSTLAQWGLVDVFELLVHPVVLGSGKRMFQDIQRRLDLKLAKSWTFQSGVVVLNYRAA
jgi:dihydrofolate reductase